MGDEQTSRRLDFSEGEIWSERLRTLFRHHYGKLTFLASILAIVPPLLVASFVPSSAVAGIVSLFAATSFGWPLFVSLAAGSAVAGIIYGIGILVYPGSRRATVFDVLQIIEKKGADWVGMRSFWRDNYGMAAVVTGIVVAMLMAVPATGIPALIAHTAPYAWSVMLSALIGSSIAGIIYGVGFYQYPRAREVSKDMAMNMIGENCDKIRNDNSDTETSIGEVQEFLPQHFGKIALGFGIVMPIIFYFSAPAFVAQLAVITLPIAAPMILGVAGIAILMGVGNAIGRWAFDGSRKVSVEFVMSKCYETRGEGLPYSSRDAATTEYTYENPNIHKNNSRGTLFSQGRPVSSPTLEKTNVPSDKVKDSGELRP